jgi:tetratricopeptide (TPR) repeat protein
VPQREEFALTYLFLGNMQQASGDHDQALATWKAGLERFPDRAELQRAVGLAGAEGSTKRSASR